MPVLVDRLLPAGARSRGAALVVARDQAALPPAARLGACAAARAVQVARAGDRAARPSCSPLRLGTNFLPELDEGAFMVQTLLPSDTSLSAVDGANRQLEERLAAMPGVRPRYRRTGRGELTEDPMPHYLSDVLIVLDPGTPSRRGRAAAGRGARSALPFGVELTTPMGMRIAEGIGGTPADIQVELFHPDLASLARQEARSSAPRSSASPASPR